MKKNFVALAALAIGAALGSGSAAAESLVLKQHDTAYVPGMTVGAVFSGPECTEGRERVYSDLLSERIAIELPAAFHAELEKSRDATAGEELQPLEVRAFVNDLDVRVCNVGDGAWKGAVQVQVTWSVAEPGGRVVYQASTQGSYLAVEPGTADGATALRLAFATAAQNFIADPRVALASRQRSAEMKSAMLTLH